MSATARAWAPVVTLVLLGVLAGCAGPSAAGPTATSGPVSAPAGTSAASQALASAPSGTGAPATSGASKTAVVDLTLTGWKSITAKGTAGTCQLATNGGVPVAFGFLLTEADYPGFGTGLYINGTGTSVSIKWYAPDNQGFVSGATDKIGTVSADNRSITLSGDLKGSPGTEHFEGTISCP